MIRHKYKLVLELIIKRLVHFVVVATVIEGVASDTLLVFQAAEDHGSTESCDMHLIVAQGNYIYRSLHLLIS